MNHGKCTKYAYSYTGAMGLGTSRKCGTTEGYCSSRLGIILGQWEKGQVVAAVFRGVKTAPSYRQMSTTVDNSNEQHVAHLPMREIAGLLAKQMRQIVVFQTNLPKSSRASKRGRVSRI